MGSGASPTRRAFHAQRLVLMIESFESFLDRRDATKKCQQVGRFFFEHPENVRSGHSTC